MSGKKIVEKSTTVRIKKPDQTKEKKPGGAKKGLLSLNRKVTLEEGKATAKNTVNKTDGVHNGKPQTSKQSNKPLAKPKKSEKSEDKKSTAVTKDKKIILTYTDTVTDTQEDIFITERLKGRSQVDAYLTAYPQATSWKRTTVTSSASKLANTGRVKKRYEELAKAFDQNEMELEGWNKELAKSTYMEVIKRNMEDMTRVNLAYEKEEAWRLNTVAELSTELGSYKEGSVKWRECLRRIVSLQSKIHATAKQKRISQVHNEGILNAVDRLNRMEGLDKPSDTSSKQINEVIQFIDVELED